MRGSPESVLPCRYLSQCLRSMRLRRLGPQSWASLPARSRLGSREPLPSGLPQVFVMINRSHPAPETHVSYGAQSCGVHVSVRVAVLSAILFLSGIGALIFETLWLRLSGLAFGNSIWAAALILSSFMAGLALGNAIAASSIIRRWRPLHRCAMLEVLVALLCCTIVFGLPALGELLRPVWQTLWNYQP